MVTYAIEERPPGLLTKVGRTMLREFRHVLPPTIFFFVGFNLILLTKRLFLAEYLIQFAGFAIATTAALIVGKVVLVADNMPFIRRFDKAPLIQPILFRAIVYTMLVFAVRLVEAFIHYIVEGGTVGGGAFVRHQLGQFSWDHFVATQMWIFVLFLIYCATTQLNDLLGDGELFKILFKRRSSELKATRRQRIRLLVRLARLTEAHSIEALRDRTTAPHAELVDILGDLSRKDGRTQFAAKDAAE